MDSDSSSDADSTTESLRVEPGEGSQNAPRPPSPPRTAADSDANANTEIIPPGMLEVELMELCGSGSGDDDKQVEDNLPQHRPEMPTNEQVIEAPSSTSSSVTCPATGSNGSMDKENHINAEFFNVEDGSRKLCDDGDDKHMEVLSQANGHLHDMRDGQNSANESPSKTSSHVGCESTENSGSTEYAAPQINGEDVLRKSCGGGNGRHVEVLSQLNGNLQHEHITHMQRDKAQPSPIPLRHVTSEASERNCNTSTEYTDPELLGKEDEEIMHGESVEDEPRTTGMDSEVVSHNVSPDIFQENCSIKEEVIDVGIGNQIVCFVNKDAKLSPSPILQYVLDIDQPFDTVISCADGKVGAHRLVLAAASPFIGTLFGIDHRLGEVGVLILPDIRISIMKILLNFCYTGSMMFPKEDEKDVFATMRVLHLGEFGELALREVNLKETPQPMSSDSNILPEQQRRSEYRHSSSGRLERNLSGGAETSATGQDLRPMVVSELLSSSSSSSSEDESESENDNENDENFEPSTGKKKSNKEKENNYSKSILCSNYNNPPSVSDSHPYVFTIAPLPPGTKVKKLQCARCPAAFKSSETLEEHLENNHSIYADSRDLEKAELQKLLKCGSSCKSKHNNIAAANHCLSKHKKTRCYTCFEVFSLKKFEQHVVQHGVKQRNGSCIVKCNWCDAGIVYQSPFDNKLTAGHCFSKHFSNVSDYDHDKDYQPPGPDTTKPKMEPVACSSKKTFDLFKIPPSSLGTSNSKTNRTPAPASSKPKMPIPNVLAMLQKASQKRKVVREIDFDTELFVKVPKATSTSKRVRLSGEDNEDKEKEPKKLHKSKRTGKPVGKPIRFDELSTDPPNYVSKPVSSRKPNGEKYRSVWFDVDDFPKTYVKVGYGKTFVMDYGRDLGVIKGEESDKEEPDEVGDELEPRQINPDSDSDSSDKDEVIKADENNTEIEVDNSIPVPPPPVMIIKEENEEINDDDSTTLTATTDIGFNLSRLSNSEIESDS